MKNSSYLLTSLASLGLFTSGTGFAQVPVESTSTITTTSSGTVNQFGTDAIVIKSTTSDAPISYSSTKTTTYVDENGNAVSTETVKSGLPVTVYYEKVGDRLVATKVMVRKAVSVSASPADSTATTTTTTSAGTISQFSPNAIVVKTTTTAAPVSYSSTKTTTYVDEDGNTVSSETVKSGLPVTVYYNQVGDQMVATKVVVKKTTSSTTTTP